MVSFFIEKSFHECTYAIYLRIRCYVFLSFFDTLFNRHSHEFHFVWNYFSNIISISFFAVNSPLIFINSRGVPSPISKVTASAPNS